MRLESVAFEQEHSPVFAMPGIPPASQLLNRVMSDPFMASSYESCHGIAVLLQVLSPAAILAVDLAALTLLDLPCLVAVILGVLADEFGWIAKSFPQAFGVSRQSGCA